MMQKSICRACNQEIYFNGEIWKHSHGFPRHIAEPLRSALENMDIIDSLIKDGWSFEYQPHTKFIEGSHKNGVGRMSICEVMKDEFGFAIARRLMAEKVDTVNSGEDSGIPKSEQGKPQKFFQGKWTAGETVPLTTEWNVHPGLPHSDLAVNIVCEEEEADNHERTES